MNNRFNGLNTEITNKIDDSKSGQLQWNYESARQFVDNWLMRGDSQNYMLFGDPGAHLNLPD
jgi:hypothetical protein